MIETYRTLIGDKLTDFKFSVTISDHNISEKAFEWCFEQWGEEGIRWNWDVTEDFEYDVVFFKTEQDMLWFMLNCEVV